VVDLKNSKTAAVGLHRNIHAGGEATVSQDRWISIFIEWTVVDAGSERNIQLQHKQGGLQGEAAAHKGFGPHHQEQF